MQKIEAKKIFLTLLAIISIGILGRFLSNLSFPDSTQILEKGENVKLKVGDSLTQKFIANRDGLTKIQFLLRTPRVKPEDTVEMKLLNEDCQTEIRDGKLTYAFLSSNNLYDFKFKRVPDSKDKTYCVKAVFKPKDGSGKAIQFFTKKDSSNLSIRPAYKNENLLQDFSELNQRMSQYKPWFLKHYYLWTIIILFAITSLGLVITLLVS